MFDKGFFGGLFDFNGDGKLDGFERAADHMAFMNMVSESEMTEILTQKKELDVLAKELTDKAVEHGGVDNATVIFTSPVRGFSPSAV